jgi:hypothetical protein
MIKKLFNKLKTNQLFLSLISISLMILFYMSLIYFENLMSAIFSMIFGTIIILMLIRANNLSEHNNIDLSKKTNPILDKLFTKLYYCCPNNIKVIKDLYQIFFLFTLIFLFKSLFLLSGLMFLIACVLVLKEQLAMRYKED